MISQLALLNKVLDTKDFSGIIKNNIDEKYFYNYQSEFNFIKNHFDQYGRVPDDATFLASFPDFRRMTVQEPESYLYSELDKDYHRSFLVSYINNMKHLVENDDIDAAWDTLQNTNEVIPATKGMTCTNILEDTSRFERYLDHCHNPYKHTLSTGFPELDQKIGGIDRENENMVIIARTGIGKCLAKGTRVLMADGSTKAVEDIKIGDRVQSFNRVNTVLDLHNGVSNGYKIIPTNGEPFVVSANHILTFVKRIEKYDAKKGFATTHTSDTELVDIMIEDYLKLSKHAKHNLKLYRPAIDYPEKVLPMHPYILGAWLGDGTSKYAQICTADYEILTAFSEYALDTHQTITECPSGYRGGKAHLYDIGHAENGFECMQTTLRKLNVLANKHIPIEYLTGGAEQRLQLLAGLLDTDGSYYYTGNLFEFTQKSKILFDNVAQLARGLGFGVNISKAKVINGVNYYRMTISGDVARIPTKIERKKARVSKLNKNPLVCGLSVEPVDRVEYYGFMCDGDSRYLLADNILTHNTWTMLKMAAAASKAGLTVGIYSGEMTTDKVAYRLDTLMGGIDNYALMRGRSSAEQEYNNYINHTLKTCGWGPIKVITPLDINGPATVNALRAFIANEKLDILFVDQYSLLEDVSGAHKENEKLANISKAIKNLQVMTKIPIISVSQQNRTKNEDKTIDTTMVFGSDRIGQDATVIIAIDKKDANDPANPYNHLLTLNIIKSRDGGSGELTYNTNLNNGTFRFVPDEKSGVLAEDDLQAMEDSYNPQQSAEEPW